MKILSWHFPLGFCQKGGLYLHKCIKESSVLLWFIHVSSLQHPPSYRPFLEDVTRLKTLSWPILCRLPLARSSVIELSWSFSYFSISTPKEMIICFWDQWSCIRAVYGAEGCCCCWSICGGLVPVACWPKECVWEPDGAVNHPDSSKPSMLGPSAGLSSQSSFSPTFSPLAPSLPPFSSPWAHEGRPCMAPGLRCETPSVHFGPPKDCEKSFHISQFHFPLTLSNILS